MTTLPDRGKGSRGVVGCATSAKYKTGMLAMLTVMSSSDPHMINLWN
jgi:hypothetical protein